MIPRWSLPCVIFLLLALGSAWSFRGEAIGSTAILPVRNSVQGWPAQRILEGGLPVGSGVWAASVAGERNAAKPAKQVAVMDAGETALLAEEIELRALGAGVELSLNGREWAALARLALNTQAVRHAYEAEIAVAVSRGDGRQRLEIPAYVEAGAALRSEFYSELLKQLGESGAMEVVRKLSDRLEARFAGFGAAVQTLDFSTGAPFEADAVSVTRTVVYWNEDNAGETARTRSETIFPKMEDPDGFQWGPLLARVASVPAKKARG